MAVKLKDPPFLLEALIQKKLAFLYIQPIA